MAIQGALSDVSLADIAQLLGVGGKTGCLTLTHEGNNGKVYFEGGRVIFASVVNRPDRLGDLLLANKVINREQFEAAMAHQATGTGQRVGEVLVELGSVTQEQLDKYISVQIEEAVYFLFQWDEGTFQFESDVAPEDVFRMTAAGELMPQKSTFFYPKLPTGLVFRLLDQDGEEAA